MAAATIVSRTTAGEEVALDSCVHKKQSWPTESFVFRITTHLGELQHTSALERIVSSTTQTFKSTRKGGGFIHNRGETHIDTAKGFALFTSKCGTHIDTAKGFASFTEQKVASLTAER